jgi:hypothetical protein
MSFGENLVKILLPSVPLLANKFDGLYPFCSAMTVFLLSQAQDNAARALTSIVYTVLLETTLYASLYVYVLELIYEVSILSSYKLIRLL